MTDFIHYVVREIVLLDYENKSSPWFSKNQPEDQGFDSPFFHTTRKTTGPSARVKPGDTIWIFSQLHSPWGKLFPALDAKIVVADKIRKDDRIEYIANKSSKWFPLLDATSTLKDLKTKPIKGDPCPLLHENLSVGFSLRSIREIFENTSLLELEHTINNSGFYFISYRIADGTKSAFDLCERISKENTPIFWDRWSLPRRLSERRELVSNSALDEFLQSIIKNRKCLRVYGVDSPKYGDQGSYSQKEKELAIEYGKFIESFKVTRKK
jgi:hypothetical protein